MLRTILALVIAAHGIGHVLFLVPLLGFVDWEQSTQSWLISNGSILRIVGAVIWLAAIAAFGAVVFGLLGERTWWRDAAVIAAVISIIGLALFWANPPTSPAVSALVFNLLVLGALLILHWPSVEAVGA